MPRYVGKNDFRIALQSYFMELTTRMQPFGETFGEKEVRNKLNENLHCVTAPLPILKQISVLCRTIKSVCAQEELLTRT